MPVRSWRTYVPSPFGQLHVRIARPADPGKARPLLCLHQTPSNSADWDALMVRMGRDRWVIAPDTPGYGQSDPPPAAAPLEQLCAAIVTGLEAIAAQEGIVLGEYDAIGHHTGSALAAELALHDTRLKRIVFCSLPAFDTLARRELLEQVDSMFAAVDGTLARAQQLLAFQDLFADRRLDGQQRQIAMAECLRLGNRMDWAYRSVFGYDLVATLRELTNQCLVLNSEDDLAGVTRDAFGHLANARYRELRGCGHGFLAFADESLTRDLKAFLDAP